MKIVYTNFVRNLCRNLTGNEDTRPAWWKNDTCPLCGQGFELDDAVAVGEGSDTVAPVVHYSCVPFPKPDFTYQT
jgi:hypothetical protein